MTASNMNIPKTIKVGYQQRSDTFTGKLAYIIYIDEKGIVRKEKSWSSWRDSKIDVNDFDNVPTSGFVMNKKVGDYRSDWNHRMAHIRIYDPRGFEFEISVENLLYILEESSSIKGKGLEGDFVYAWDRSDLVLLPVSSQEYQSSLKFTAMKSMKVCRKDMVDGCVYMTKDMREVMYLGNHEIFEYERDYSNEYSGSISSHRSQGKSHVFAYITPSAPRYEGDKPDLYWFQSGFTKLASRISEVVSSNFADEYDKFKKSIQGNQCKRVVVYEHPIGDTLSNMHHYRISRLIKDGDNYIRVDISKAYNHPGFYTMSKECSVVIKDGSIIEQRIMGKSDRYGYWVRDVRDETPYTLEQLVAMSFYDMKLINEVGGEIGFIH